METKRPDYPKPFVITVGMTKGGACKTWTAFNLASFLGLAGNSVLAIDLNPQHDLAADHRILMEEGVYPRFKVLSHDIVDEQGRVTPMPDLRPYGDFQFIIYDTCQFFNFPVIRYAWQNCHLMVAPYTPDCADLKNYATAIYYYRHLPAPRGPVAILPTKTKILKNSAAQSIMQDALELMRSTGCEVPAYSQSYMLEYNDLMSAQNTRWVYSRTMFKGAERTVRQTFLDKVDLNLCWILSVMEKHYGPLPAPVMPMIPRNDIPAMFEKLRAEAAQLESEKVAVV